MAFKDSFEHAIDAKQRLAIPAKHRSQRDRAWGRVAGTVSAGGLTGPDADGSDEGSKVWVAVAMPDHLRLYPEPVFEELARQLRSPLVSGKPRSDFNVALFGSASDLDEDSVGRVVVPKAMQADAGLPAEVVVVGVNDHLQVRSREAWAAERARMRREMVARINEMDSFGGAKDGPDGARGASAE